MSKEKKLIDMTLSELVDESLKKGLVPIFEFIDKDIMVDKSVPDKEYKPEWEITKYEFEPLSKPSEPFWIESSSRHWEQAKTNNDYKIFEVKRLNDGEIFTLGDLNEYPTGRTDTIKEFQISSTKPLTYSTNMMVFRTDTIWSNLLLAKKSKPKEELKEPERIEVRCFDEHDRFRGSFDTFWYQFATRPKQITPHQKELIKQAIEQVLNADKIYYTLHPHTYTEEYVNKMMEETWKAARKINLNQYPSYFYPQLPDYQSSLK